MNFVAPTFHFQQGDELCFQTPSQQHQQQQQILQDMFVSGPSMAVIEDRHHQPTFKLHTVPPPRRKPVGTPPTPVGQPTDLDDDNRNSKRKKIIHRDVERQRRHEMAMLYSSLRSLLPLEYLKGKRSISDHMNEAANYIRYQQKKIRELTEKRDGLRRLSLSSSSSSGSLNGNGSSNSPVVTVQPCWAGVEVVINSGTNNGGSLASVLEALAREGLDAMSCISTNVNEELIYTIQCEVGNLSEVDLSGLERKLTDLALPNWASS